MARTTIRTEDITADAVTAPKIASGAVPEYDDSGIQDDIALIGFKVAANGSLAKYDLVDQTIDDFQDASGIDASASTNEARDSSGKYYSGSVDSSGSTGFTVTGSGQTFTVPSGVSSLDIKCFGAGGNNKGGFSTGALATSASTQYLVVVGELEASAGTNNYNSYGYGGGGRAYGYPSGGGLTGVFTGTTDITDWTSSSERDRMIICAGGAGGRGGQGGAQAGDGGGTSGTAGDYNGNGGGAGTQSANGSGYSNGGSGSGMRGGESGAANESGAGGGGFCGGGGGDNGQYPGGGGSGYVGTQNSLTSGATYVGASSEKTSDSDYPGADVAKVVFNYTVQSYDNMTLISNSTTAEAVPTKGDIVITYTNGAGTATLNTDLKAYVSRDNGTTYTQGTLASQGTSGGHTIVTFHDLDISSQSSGTAMRYKIETLNQSVSKQTRIQAVSLGWS